MSESELVCVSSNLLLDQPKRGLKQTPTKFKAQKKSKFMIDAITSQGIGKQDTYMYLVFIYDERDPESSSST